MEDHEVIERPNWETKIVCTCGERCPNWMEFYRHRGDAYRDQLTAEYYQGWNDAIEARGHTP